MRFEINIDHPIEEIEASRRRMEARADFRYVDRVPVGFCLAPRYFTPIFDMPYSALFENVEEHYHWQLQFLKYRIENMNDGVSIRGIEPENKSKCRLVLDDMAVAGELHFPCIIYMREHGEPIGFVNKDMRQEREEWMENHDPSADPICSKMCLDVCVHFNKVANGELK